jgi:hypothetical protein
MLKAAALFELLVMNPWNSVLPILERNSGNVPKRTGSYFRSNEPSDMVTKDTFSY